MFEKLAKCRMLQSRRTAPGLGPFAPANDNRPPARASTAGRAQRPRLVCRWSTIAGTKRLACRWEIESSDEPDRSLCINRPAAKSFHKTFFQLSYQPGLSGRATDRSQPAREPNASSVGSLAVLHGGHLQLASKLRPAIPPCSCELFAIGMGSDIDSRRFAHGGG